MRISDWSSDVCSSDLEALGVHLPPASPILEPWTPAQADSDSDLDHELSLAGEPILMAHFGPAIEQCAAFALAKDPRFAGRHAAADASMSGYHWYACRTRIGCPIGTASCRANG